MEVRLGERGETEVKVGGAVCLRDFQLLVAGPEWKFVCGVSNCEKTSETRPDGRQQRTTRGTVVGPGGTQVGLLRTVAVWTEDRIDLSYELRMTQDLEVETIRLNGFLPCQDNAGMASWHIVRPGEVKTGVFPERLSDEGDFGDWDFDWFGWILPGDHGLRFTPNRDGLTTMYMQDGRRWGGDYFQTCWTLAGKSAVRGGDVFRCSIVIEPLSTKHVASRAFKAGVSLLPLQVHLTPVPEATTASGEIVLRNLLAERRVIELDWRMTDNVLRPLAHGHERLSLLPLQTVKRPFTGALPPGRDCRVSVDARDPQNRVEEKTTRRFELDQLAGPRRAISLNGDWDFMSLSDGELTYPPVGQWQKRVVPSSFDATTAHRFWFRRRFEVPESTSGRRIKLRFGAVNFDAKVYVNGKAVGGHFGGYTPFEVEVTDAAKVGADNEVCVAVTSWIAACTKPLAPFQPKPLEHPAGRLPDRALLAPIGGSFLLCGIWQDVSLEAVPQVHVDNVFVRTSVRRRELRAQLTIANQGNEEQSVRITNAIYDCSGLTKRLRPKVVKVAPGETRQVEFVESWPSPKLWSLDSPHLYQLKTSLVSDGVTKGDTRNASARHSRVTAPIDEVATRFGFREIWTEGKRVLLNGVPVSLFATSAWGMNTWEEATRHVSRMKRAGTRSMRMHTQPWNPFVIEAADELGMLIVDEGAVYCYERSYAVEDERFWENYARHLRELALRDRNHPSLAIYSLENEIISCGGKPEVWEPRLARLSDTVRQVDPTRLIMCESDLDPGGKMDLIGMHYPREYWSGYTLYPDKCYWMDSPAPYLGQQWKWRRNKPLYIGEFDGGFMVWYPQYQAFWLGDDAYIGRAPAWTATPANSKARLEMIGTEVDAYRQYGVTGLNPWFDPQEVDVFGPVAYAPVSVSLRERTHNFRPGDEVERTLAVHNDTFRPAALQLRWEARLSGKVLRTEKSTFTLQPAQSMDCRARFLVPTVGSRTSLLFSAAVVHEGKVAQKKEQSLSIFPSAPSAPEDSGLVLFDRKGKTRQVFSQLGLRCKSIADLGNLPEGSKALVIGAGSLDESISTHARKVADFVAGGGSVVCLEQEKYPARWMPVRVEVDSTHMAVKAFARAFRHPALRDLGPEDLTFWRPDNVVCRNTLLKPLKGNATAVLDAGGIRSAIHDMNGLNWTPLLEVPYGKGRYLLCQLCLIEKLAVEPMAGRLLVNLLNYAAKPPAPTSTPTALLADPDGALKRTLDGLGLVYDSLLGRVATADLSRYGLVIIGGGPTVWQEVASSLNRLRDFARNGGTLWLHRVTPEQAEVSRSLLDLDFTLAEARPESLYKIAEDAILSGLSNHELYWRDTPIWDQYTPMRRILEHSFVVTGANSRVKVLTDPPGLVKVALGRGVVLVDQLLWDTGGTGEAVGRNRLEGLRIASNLLTNFGAKLDVSPFKSVDLSTCFQVDLSGYCNLGFAGETQDGWMGHGPDAMSSFPTGSATLAGVPYNIAARSSNKGKSVIGLYGTWKQHYPKEVRGVAVGRKASRLYFLHTCAWGRPEGAEAAKYVIHYNDGGQLTIPVRIGTEIRDWYGDPAPLPFAEVAWSGRCPDKTGEIGAYSMEWVNPYPEKTIVSLDFVSAQAEPVVVVIAVSGKASG